VTFMARRLDGEHAARRKRLCRPGAPCTPRTSDGLQPSLAPRGPRESRRSSISGPMIGHLGRISKPLSESSNGAWKCRAQGAPALLAKCWGTQRRLLTLFGGGFRMETPVLEELGEQVRSLLIRLGHFFDLDDPWLRYLRSSCSRLCIPYLRPVWITVGSGGSSRPG